MEKIIKRIIDIEYQAQAVVDNAAKEREERKRAQQEVLKEREGKITQDANRKIGQIREREMKEVAKIIGKEDEKTQVILEKMVAETSAMENTWIDQLVASVIKR